MEAIYTAAPHGVRLRAARERARPRDGGDTDKDGTHGVSRWRRLWPGPPNGSSKLAFRPRGTHRPCLAQLKFTENPAGG
jgi:hypothetical protein